MLKVKIKTDSNIKITVPVPYSILRLSSSLLTSRAVWQYVDKKWLAKHTDAANFPLDPANIEVLKKYIKLLIRELHNYKGLVLVDVRSQDGTKVLITL